MGTNDITISLAQLIWLTGGILALAGFFAWASKPFKKLDNHEQRIETLEQAEKSRKATDRFTAKALNAIVNHMIDGDNTEDLKRVRDEYQNEIINKI